MANKKKIIACILSVLWWFLSHPALMADPSDNSPVVLTIQNGSKQLKKMTEP